MKITTHSEEDTVKAARAFAAQVGPGVVICLYGTLGMGKSVFARALIRALSGDEGLEVPSPTFTLVETYETRAGPVFHFDLYRLEAPEEIYELGWEEALGEGIIVAEWPERLGPFLPGSRVDIHLQAVENEETARHIQITHIG